AYATPLSLLPGEVVSLHLSSGVSRVDVEVARIGVHREVVWRRGELEAREQALPDDVVERGCGWPVAAQIEVGKHWRSGYYEIRIDAADSRGRPVRHEAFFV